MAISDVRLNNKALLLLGIFPFAIRLGRGKYVRWLQSKSSVHPNMDSHSESTRLLTEIHQPNRRRGEQAVSDETADERSDGSERFDLYFGAVSFIVDAMALISVGCSRKVWQLYSCQCLNYRYK